MKIDDLLICDDISQIYDHKIIIYGTGLWGSHVYKCLKALRKDVLWVCTTSEQKEYFCGLEIKTIKWIRENCDKKDILIIVASACYGREMIRECENLHFYYAKICTMYSFFTSLRMHRDDSRIPDEFRKKLQADLKVSEKRVEHYGKVYTLETLAMAAEASSDTILIYQPGKVGSRSIWSALKGNKMHFHTLAVLYGFDEFDSDLIWYYHQKLKEKKVKIITAVREPIARDISGFFQGSDTDLWPFSAMNNHLLLWYGYYRKEGKKLDDSELQLRMPRWTGSFNDAFCRMAKIIQEKKLDEFTWFDYELKEMFDIDVYQYPFDQEQGYSVIEKNNTEVLIVKLEKLSCLGNVISEFVGNQEINLENANVGEDKLYSYAYKELKRTIQLDKDYFDYYYRNNEKLKHFYSADEITSFKNNWKKHIII